MSQSGLATTMEDGAARAPPRLTQSRRRRWLQAVQIVDRALCMHRGGEREPLVVLQHVEPRRDVARMILAAVRGKTQVGAQERSPKLGDKLLARAASIAPALAPEVPIEPRVQCHFVADLEKGVRPWLKPWHALYRQGGCRRDADAYYATLGHDRRRDARVDIGARGFRLGAMAQPSLS